MHQLTFKHLNDITNEYDLFLFDLWGVIIEDKEVYPGATNIVNQVMKKTDVIFLTNTPRTATKITEYLKKGE